MCSLLNLLSILLCLKERFRPLIEAKLELEDLYGINDHGYRFLHPDNLNWLEQYEFFFEDYQRDFNYDPYHALRVYSSSYLVETSVNTHLISW
ncbi:MAG: hypothetical protein R2880_06715 [Deinococcales bacterium]